MYTSDVYYIDIQVNHRRCHSHSPPLTLVNAPGCCYLAPRTSHSCTCRPLAASSMQLGIYAVWTKVEGSAAVLAKTGTPTALVQASRWQTLNSVSSCGHSQRNK